MSAYNIPPAKEISLIAATNRARYEDQVHVFFNQYMAKTIVPAVRTRMKEVMSPEMFLAFQIEYDSVKELDLRKPEREKVFRSVVSELIKTTFSRYGYLAVPSVKLTDSRVYLYITLLFDRDPAPPYSALEQSSSIPQHPKSEIKTESS